MFKKGKYSTLEKVLRALLVLTLLAVWGWVPAAILACLIPVEMEFRLHLLQRKHGPGGPLHAQPSDDPLPGAAGPSAGVASSTGVD